MNYLVVRDGESIHAKAMRGDFAVFHYPAIRKFLEQLYPNKPIASPLEDLPTNSHIVTVYVSPNKQGHGRINYNFQQWGVGN